MGCLFGKEETKCPTCQIKTELPEQLFDSDVEAYEKFVVLHKCKNGHGLAADGILWSDPRLESYEKEIQLTLTLDILKQFWPSKPYDQPCAGFKLFFKDPPGQTNGLWLPRSNLVEGTKLYVAVEKPPAAPTVIEMVAGAVFDAGLSPENLVPIPDRLLEKLVPIVDPLGLEERFGKLAKSIEAKGAEWGDYEDEMEHKKARVLRWDPPPTSPQQM